MGNLPFPKRPACRTIIAAKDPRISDPRFRASARVAKIWAKWSNAHPRLVVEKRVPRNGDVWSSVSRNSGEIMAKLTSPQATLFPDPKIG